MSNSTVLITGYNTSPRPVLQYLITAPADIKNKIIDEKVKAPSPGTDVSVIYAGHRSQKPTLDRWSWQYNPLSDPTDAGLVVRWSSPV